MFYQTLLAINKKKRSTGVQNGPQTLAGGYAAGAGRG